MTTVYKSSSRTDLPPKVIHAEMKFIHSYAADQIRLDYLYRAGRYSGALA
jgi:hypothetical protein